MSMMTAKNSTTEELIEWAAAGDRPARRELLVLHRQRLRNMIAVRMDPRLRVRRVSYYEPEASVTGCLRSVAHASGWWKVW